MTIPPIQKRKYRSYSPTKIAKAYDEVATGNMTVYKAAKIFEIPTQTLRDRVLGKVDFETLRSGPRTVLDQEEEERLVNHIKQIANVGYAYTRTEIVNIASEYAVCLKKREQEHPLTLKWFYNFLQRWPELKVRRPNTVTELRAKATSEESIGNYFNELKTILDKYEFESRPEAIYNVDEKGIQQHFKPPSVVADADCFPSIITSERSSTTTLLGCGNALGHAIPPYFIFAGARMRQELLAGCTIGADGTVSKSGWSNGEIFQTYLREHFLKYAGARTKDKPLLLLYDGHRSHISPSIIDWAIENNVILYVLPPHTSHVLQPMDVGCFGPFSRMYSNECMKYQRTNGTTVNKYSLCPIACKAYAAALSSENLQSAFRKSGIFPFGPENIDRSLLIMSNARNKMIAEDIAEGIQQGENVDEDEGQIQNEGMDQGIINEERQERDQRIVQEEGGEGIENEERDEGVIHVERDEGIIHIERDEGIAHDERDAGIVGDIQNEPAVEVIQTFFKKKRPTFVPPFKTKQRRSISSVIAGKAITEKETTDKVLEYYAESKSHQTSKSVAPKKKSKAPIKKTNTGIKKTNKNPGPSGLAPKKTRPAEMNTFDSDSSTDASDESEQCCVCKKFQPSELKDAISLVFTKWAQCMFEGCDHWVHLKYCVDINVLRRHDIFFCPCHGLPCKTSIRQEE